MRNKAGLYGVASMLSSLTCIRSVRVIGSLFAVFFLYERSSFRAERDPILRI